MEAQANIGLEVAQKLLQSTLPARLAYNWSDGTPRVVPIWFHWNGSEIVMASPANAPKAHALADGTAVAVTIDSSAWPYDALLVRGPVQVDEVDAEAAKRAAISLSVSRSQHQYHSILPTILGLQSILAGGRFIQLGWSTREAARRVSTTSQS